MHESQAPRTETARALARIWAQVLGPADITADSSFFELGGHSLRVIKVVRAVDKQLKVKIAPRVLFDHPPLQELADLIEAQQTAGGQLPAGGAPGAQGTPDASGADAEIS